MLINEKYDKLITVINSSSNIIIISHEKPDGDAFGSSLAVYKALINMGKKPHIFNPTTNLSKDNSLYTLPNSQHINCDKILKNYDLAIACDCADKNRMKNLLSYYENAKFKVCFDHHQLNDNYGDLNFVDSDSPANSQIVFKALEYINNKIPCLDDEVAYCLYAGLVTDTGSFAYSSVNSETFEVASKLKHFNINTAKITEELFTSVKLDVFKLRNRVFSKAKFFENNQIGIIYFSQEDFKTTNTTEENTEGAVSILRDIKELKIAVSITQLETLNDYKISFRTIEGIDANEMAKWYGGGGHKAAAGCRIQGYFEDIYDKLLKTCKDYLL